MSIRSFVVVLRATLVTTALVTAAAPVRAELGGAPMQTPAGATVNANAPGARAASAGQGMSGTTATTGFTVKQTTLSSGTVVREYVAQDGRVFGVAWSGPAAPDLSSLFGSYFPQYIDGVKTLRAQGQVRGPVVLEQSNFVVHSGGHMGAFFGQAYLPQALPAGVSADDVR